MSRAYILAGGFLLNSMRAIKNTRLVRENNIDKSRSLDYIIVN